MRYFFPILALLCISTILYTFVQNRSQSPLFKKSLSGAYDALNTLGSQRTYPFEQLPAKAHFAAWEAAQSSFSAEKNAAIVDPWESMGPHNRGGRTLSLALNPQNTNTIYAGSASGGLWRSYTGGVGAQAWERIETGFPVLGVSSISFAANDSMTMYIGTGEVYNHEAAGTGAAYRNTRGTYGIGILKSEDGGITWEKSLDWTYAQNRGVWAVKVSPTNTDIVYAATTEGTYKSTDAGTTWTNVHDVVMGTDLSIHPDDPEKVVAVYGNLGSADKGIYKTIDGGNTWNKITSTSIPTDFQGKILLGETPADSRILYASIGNGFGFTDGASWLLYSRDFGDTWILKNTEDYSRWQGWFAHDVAVSPTDPSAITVIGIEVWQSTDGGSTLIQKAEGGVGYSDPDPEGPYGSPTYVHSDAHAVIYHPTDPNKIYIASDGGVSVSEDGGDTYKGVNGGYQTVQFYNGFSNSSQDSILCLGGLQDNSTILWNGDNTWRLKHGGDGSWTATNPHDDNVLYVSSQYLNIAKSVNRGINFIGLPLDTDGEITSFIAPFVIAQNDSKILYAGSRFVYRTLNSGNNWQRMNTVITTGNPIIAMAVAPSDDDVLYIASAPYVSTPNVALTTTGGVTFKDITQNLPDRFPSDLAVSPDDAGTAYITYSGFGTGHVFKTTDFGDNWTDISGDLIDVPTNAVVVDPSNTDHVYIGNDIGVFVSTDAGASWEAFQDGLPSAVLAFDLTISPSNHKLRIATHGNGAYQRDLLSPRPINTSTQEQFTAVRAVEVYPNPAVDVLNINFELLEKTAFNITLIDVNGRVLKQLKPTTDREQKLSIDVSDLISGTYYLRFASAKGARSFAVFVA